jgi:prepilin-type N-terminal cleavage/methylation domain-containing protein
MRIRRRKLAFTLVELLICLFIILVIAAITFPIVTASKRKGYETSNISKLRQIGVAWVLYSSDNSEIYPLIKTLYESNSIPRSELVSKCDENSSGWANMGFAFFPSKVSVVDRITYTGKNFSLDDVELGKARGWAVIPGCNAKMFGNQSVRKAEFVGKYQRLNMDGSVVVRDIPLDQNWVSDGLVFNDDPKPLNIP